MSRFNQATKLVPTALPCARRRAWRLRRPGRATNYRPSGFLERRLDRLLHRVVSFPALILELDLLDDDSIRIAVKVGKYLIFRNPASVNFVGENELSGLIVDFQNEVLAEVFE